MEALTGHQLGPYQICSASAVKRTWRWPLGWKRWPEGEGDLHEWAQELLEQVENRS